MRAFNRMLRGRVPSNQRPLASIIKGMFTNGEQGAWYDPSDLSTLYQDAAGTIPVTAVEQPVGLMLDKSRGLVLGPELFAGAYQTGASTTATYVGNEATTTFGGQITVTSSNWLTIPGKTEPGAVAVEFWATWVSGGDLEVGRAWYPGKTITAASNAGVRTKYTAFINSSFSVLTNGRVTFGASSAGSVWKIELISVRELPGAHASQTTATSRPVLSARVNLLTKTEDFAHSDWPIAAYFSYEAAADPNGGNTATKIVSIGAPAVPARDVVATANSLDFVLYLKPGTIIPQILIRNKTTATGLIPLSTLSTSRSNQYGSWVVTPVSDGWVKFKITLTSGFTVGNVVTLHYGAASSVSTGLFWYVWHPDIRPANTSTDLPDYQRVNTATNYDTAGFPRIERFDAVDDVQNITFPVSLGSNCTVARVAQGGAVTILTGQTIGTSYQINQSHAGLIVVNRALTQSETNAVTRYFQNKGSGK